MSFSYAIACGITSRSTAPGDYGGMSEFRIRNLSSEPALVRQKIFFADRPPVDLAELEIGPLEGPYQEFPRDLPEEHRDAGPWGSVISSSQPLAVLHIGLARRNGQSSDHAFGGGCAMHLAASELSARWLFPDSFRMFVKPGDAFPFSQYEWLHILNPSSQPLHLTLEAGEGAAPLATRTLEVAPERVLFLDDPNLHDRMCCWVRLTGSHPFLAQAERVIFGPEGMDQWGVVVGCASPGAIPPSQAWAMAPH